MNTPRPDLGDLLHDAVDAIEPTDRLGAIRARTASPARAAARPWFYAAGGVVLATAATVAAFAVLDDPSTPTGHHDHGAMTSPSAPPGTQLVAAYFLGDTPSGPRLFREFDDVPAGDPLQAALDRIERPAGDPDYRTAWTTGSFGAVTLEEQGIEVEVSDADAFGSDPLAVQQVVYTLQAAVGERLPVWFWRDGQRGNAPYSAAAQDDVLSPISISDPTEGAEAHEVFTARGAANSFEATVPWEVRAQDGGVVRQGYATAAGWGDRLYPWEARVDLRGLPAGSYTFVAMTADPSDGEGAGPVTDTRTIVVR